MFFFRDPQSLDPPEVSNAKLQYAGWGPKGQQLVSRAPRPGDPALTSIRCASVAGSAAAHSAAARGVSARVKRPSPSSVEDPLKAGVACASGSTSSVLKRVPARAVRVGDAFPAGSEKPRPQRCGGLVHFTEPRAVSLASLPRCHARPRGADEGRGRAAPLPSSTGSWDSPQLGSHPRPQLCPKHLHAFLLKSAKLRCLGTLSGGDRITKGLWTGLEDAAGLVISWGWRGQLAPGQPPPAGPAAE